MTLTFQNREKQFGAQMITMLGLMNRLNEVWWKRYGWLCLIEFTAYEYLNGEISEKTIAQQRANIVGDFGMNIIVGTDQSQAMPIRHLNENKHSFRGYAFGEIVSPVSRGQFPMTTLLSVSTSIRTLAIGLLIEVLQRKTAVLLHLLENSSTYYPHSL